jgi:hypothetical protein
VASIIGTAIIPALIANKFFLPRHLLPPPGPEQRQEAKPAKPVLDNDK